MADTLANLSCDIIIPAYQNETTLPLTLKALEAQTIPSPWQVRVLIADDGSTDRTAAVANQFTHRRKLNLAVIAGKHAGAAAARNQALSQAQAALVFFLGADIILCPGSLAAHLNWHQHHPAPSLGALGFVGWDPRLKPSPLMEWSIHGGPQNDYDSLLGKAFADPKHYFYGSHLSLKRSFLQNDQFSPVFSSYGWEDLELGRRLAAKGLKLRVLTEARALHHHFYRPSSFIKRQYLSGRALVIYQSLYPREQLISPPKRTRRVKYGIIKFSGLYTILSLIVENFQSKINSPFVFSILSITAFWRGIWQNKLKNIQQ